MNCRDLDTFWNDRLDGIEGRLGAVEVRSHLDSCAACRAREAGYERLARGLPALRAGREFDLALGRRIVAAAQVRPRREILSLDSIRSVRSGAWPRIAAAAAILLTIGGLSRLALDRREVGEIAKVEPVAGLRARSLEVVVSEATAATLSLARETSAPAARLGRDVLAGASGALPVGSVSLAAKPVPTDLVAPALSLERIGDGVQAGLRPFSAPTRRAFGFLMPRPVVGDRSARRPSGSGA